VLDPGNRVLGDKKVCVHPVYRLDGSGADHAVRDCPCDNLGNLGCLFDPCVDGNSIKDVALILIDAFKDIPVMRFVKASDKLGWRGLPLVEVGPSLPGWMSLAVDACISRIAFGYVLVQPKSPSSSITFLNAVSNSIGLPLQVL